MWRFKECCKPYKNRFFCQGQRKSTADNFFYLRKEVTRDEKKSTMQDM